MPVAKYSNLLYNLSTVTERTVAENYICMRAKVLSALALGLMLMACTQEIREPDPITVMVTVDYGAGKMLKFIYLGNLVWQSDPNVSEVAYHQDGDMVYLSFVSQDGKENQLSWKGGELVKKL